MAEPFRPDFPANQYRVDPIYARMTLPRNTNDDRAALPSVRDLFGELSVTSQFKVTLYLGDTYPDRNSDSDINAWLVTAGVLGGLLPDAGSTYLSGLRYEFMCNETFLPGASLTMAEETGSRQGVIERFPIRRDFPEITMTFYVDAEYGIIRLFEEWMNFINPLYNKEGRLSRANPRGGVGQFNDEQFFRFRYPDTYKRDIAITKFERDIFVNPNTKDVTRTPSMLTYKFINAFPTNLTALPVTYEGSTITKTTVTFNYDRYVILNHFGTGQNQYANEPVSENGETVSLATPSVSWTGNNTYTTATPPPFGVNSAIDASPYINPSK
jgi:hypothetical protein